MARRNKRNNAKPDQETDSTIITAPHLQPEGAVEGMETNVQDTEDTPDQVTVNENEDGEATHGTTEEGDESDVENTDKIPQNDVDTIQTTPAPNDIAKEADENRTSEELQYANESNPNQKGRNAAAPHEYDQDGNLRTDGYSYGVSADDTRGIDTEAVAEQNAGEAPEEDSKDKFEGKRIFVAKTEQTDTVNTDDTNVEDKPEDVAKLEKEFSDKDNSISARVISSTGSYYKVKFFKDNKPFITYKAKTAKLDKGEVKAFLKAALKNGV